MDRKHSLRILIVDRAASDVRRRTCGREAVRVKPVDRYWNFLVQLDALICETPTAPLYTRDLAGRVGISPRTLQNAVQAVYGLSPHRYIRLMRLWSAHRQLQTGRHSVKAAALENGFWHLGDFSRLYKSTFGETPSATLAAATARVPSASSIGFLRK